MILDPVDYAIISQSLIAVAREMGVKLVRSAYSTVLREARDGSAALLDAQGNTVAQAELIPMQLGTIGHVFRACQALYPNADLSENDLFIINDPFSGGQHLQDIFLFQPIFFQRELIAFAASVAHHIDISGGDPGLNTAAPDVYAEGLIIPPLKLNLERDWHGGAFKRLLRANVRVPHQTMGDLDAQIAANAIGKERVIELAGRYGAPKLRCVMTALLDYSEARMRAAIRAIPNGIYTGEDAVDDDGLSDVALPVKVRIEIQHERIDIDFAGTAGQVRRNLNSPFASTVSTAHSVLKAVLTAPDIPFNAGAFRPVTVRAPLGCMLNPHHPAPVRARMEVCFRAWNAMMKALSQAVPQQVIACGFDTTTVGVMSQLRQAGGWSVYLEIFGGGYGAAIDQDGCDAVDGPLSNCANTPIEALQQDFPFFRVLEYRLRPDSCGRGKSRGGLGLLRRYEILEHGVRLSLYSDRFRRPAEGLFGGTEGATGFCRIERGNEIIHLKSKDAIDLVKGDIVTLAVGGGGGYGRAESRPQQRIDEDLADGLISAEYAAGWRRAGES